MTKTILIPISVVLLYVTACSKKAADDQLPASLQKVIAQDTSCICDPYLKKYTWRNQVVYLLGAAGPACDWAPLYYTAVGEPLTMATGYTVDNFWKEAKIIKIAWSCGK
jgi:hypothetical protein